MGRSYTVAPAGAHNDYEPAIDAEPEQRDHYSERVWAHIDRCELCSNGSGECAALDRILRAIVHP